MGGQSNNSQTCAVMLPAIAVAAAGAAAQNAHAKVEPLSARLLAAARVVPTAVRCATSEGTPVCVSEGDRAEGEGGRGNNKK